MLASAQEAAPTVAAGEVRLLLLNGLGAGEGGPGADEATLTVSGGSGTHALAPLAANLSGVGGAAHAVDLPAAGAPLVSVSSAVAAAEGGSSQGGSSEAVAAAAPSRLSVLLGDQLPGGACTQSLQLVALLGGSVNTTPTAAGSGVSADTEAFAPRLLHVDVSGGECHVPSLDIPQVVVPAPKVTPTPFPVPNYDLTGMGAGAFEGLLDAPQESAAAARRSRSGSHSLLASLGFAGCWLVARRRAL